MGVLKDEATLRDYSIEKTVKTIRVGLHKWNREGEI